MKLIESFKNNFKSILKNFLIFVPLILSNANIEINLFNQLFCGFIVFTLITQANYITNNYTDRKIDILNVVKKKQIIFKFDHIVYLNFLIFVLIFFLNIYGFKVKFLIYYQISFYLYNFLFKKVKYFDIFFLISFYILRLWYGADLIEINLTNEFLIFFISLFGFLAIGKRVIQIYSNKLKNKNKIISYFDKDLVYLKNIMEIFFWTNISIFLFYGMKNYFYINYNFDNNYLLTNNILIFIFIFFLYGFNFYKLKSKFKENLINEDIFYFVIKDKKIVYSILISLMILFFYKIL